MLRGGQQSLQSFADKCSKCFTADDVAEKKAEGSILF